MTAEVFIWVSGQPASQAGTRAVPTRGGTRQISTGSAGLLAWRNAVTAEALKVWHGRTPLDGPVAVEVEFVFAPPKTRLRKVAAAGGLPAGYQLDLDKLQRAIGDSLERAGVITNDARICQWLSSKVERFPGPPGVAIVVAEIVEP